MSIIENYHEIIQKALVDNSLKTLHPNNLYKPIDYILNIGGKRLRPIMVMLGANLFDGNMDEVIKPALAIEFFHNFTLIHDDIMDKAPLRRGETTVHVKYGLNTGILSGDALLIKAYQLLEDLPAEVFKNVTTLFSKTAAEVCEGQQYDMDFESKEEVTYQEYINMITLKTGVMVGASFKMGGIIANANNDDLHNLYEFGKNLGIAYQLKDDFLDVFGNTQEFGKQHAGDIFENKKTILYIKALEQANKEEKDELAFWYGMCTDNIDKVYAVEKIFKKLDVDHQVIALIREYTKTAKSYLEKLNISEEKKQTLLELSSSLIERKS